MFLNITCNVFLINWSMPTVPYIHVLFFQHIDLCGVVIYPMMLKLSCIFFFSVTNIEVYFSYLLKLKHERVGI